MNVALYNQKHGHQLLGQKYYPGCTREQVIEMALGIQIEAKEDGLDLSGSVLVAWKDQPENFISVFTLGDDSVVTDMDLLNSIEALARTKH